MKNLVEHKPVLAFETSENLCGVCIYFSDEKYFSSIINLKHSHSEKIFEAAEWLFRTSGIKPEDLDTIAISEGPGSFTGLRIGFSAAKGIAYGANIPIVPVPTYEAFAFQLAHIKNDGDEFIISNKVNKEEVYFAKFQIRANSYIFAEDLTILRKDFFIRKAEGIKVFGNAAVLLDKSVEYPSTPDPLFIAKWAIEFGTNKKTLKYDFMEPNYLKDFIIKEKN
ncbi:MAG: tRNA (adenosine(37)-N6)-threonylcarbamoyltransferase complex dimerization subunit type 1 TsaB [Ignavibacteriaceae bacterium]|nr:tRNA (adenosine(37)-N6)-threonylcarbamoyltransferase complex dimerization subunit type 1 TsaB [Ignavibacteriaceae bacterium]MCW8816323.1 tRNA (adenosine(37)-N6)-threonylcarbamoyltransferase complex dimerization subunit type 1 TsaB [Ignavibacteriaceae bacterium]MCW8823995.1 tRNA (adenosine(37)-N6)-threonylcarbamoyltransferase complex dimerization subunit type 1 TsaB [Ignavibacteriaceae bacterium]MCW9096251.1 tRNA (adenosine(37)-N6)-threonylcarbamoyltransferase complex dimerization subunit type